MPTIRRAVTNLLVCGSLFVFSSAVVVQEEEKAAAGRLLLRLPHPQPLPLRFRRVSSSAPMASRLFHPDAHHGPAKANRERLRQADNQDNRARRLLKGPNPLSLKQ